MEPNSTEVETQRPRRAIQPQTASVAPGSLWKTRTICDYRGYGRTKLHEDVKSGLWTKGIKLSARCVRWPASECVALNQARIAGQTDDQIRELVKRLEAARGLAGVRG